MPNFTKSSFDFAGVTYSRYTADRKRGGASWVFYDTPPVDTTYYPTWPLAIQIDTTLGGRSFIDHLNGDLMHVDFYSDLDSTEETALETLYTNHVAPVPV